MGQPSHLFQGHLSGAMRLIPARGLQSRALSEGRRLHRRPFRLQLRFRQTVSSAPFFSLPHSSDHRRSCPGKKLGLNNVMLICSSILSAFDILPVPDENGKLTPPNPKYINGLARYVVYLHPFAVRMLNITHSAIQKASKSRSGPVLSKLPSSSRISLL